ncbi:MAG: RNase adapter RapZ [Acidaminococcaceae bacterium]
MGEPRILIITGMSGAGKTQVVRTLEDLNFFCVDNLPPSLIPKFTELCLQTSGKVAKVALVVDIRGGEFFNETVGVLDELQHNGVAYDLLFLDASDAALVSRYKETRRPHPLAESGGLSKGIAKEREIVSCLRSKATYILDTTKTTPAILREKIMALYGGGSLTGRMNVVVQSFGFKHGLPLDADMIFDVRFLPNPFYIPELKHLTGNDQAVIDYIWQQQVTKNFVAKLDDLLLFLLPQYVKEGKSQLAIAIGCTGGNHRSVFLANRIGTLVKEQGYMVQVAHRDLTKR